MAVFGHVDDAARLMHGAGLVLEAAHRLDGQRFDEAGLARGNLEDVAVLFVARDQPAAREVGARAFETLFAGQPAAPGRRAARTVQLRAGEAEVLALGTARPRVVNGRRRAARSGRCAAAVIVDTFLDVIGQFFETGAEGAVFRESRRHLVVADQDHPPVGTREGGHAVVSGRHRETVVHRVACPGDHPIAEPVGQVQQFARVRPQRAYADVPGMGRSRQGRAGGGHCDALQESASVDHGMSGR